MGRDRSIIAKSFVPRSRQHVDFQGIYTTFRDNYGVKYSESEIYVPLTIVSLRLRGNVRQSLREARVPIT